MLTDYSHLLPLILEQVHHPLALFDQGHCLQQANARLAELLGVDISWLSAQPNWQQIIDSVAPSGLLPPPNRIELLQLLTEAQQHGSAIAHLSLGDDSLTVRATVLEDGIVVVILPAAKPALDADAVRYRAIVEQQAELICCFLPDRTITYVNQTFCNYFQTTQAALMGQRFCPSVTANVAPEAEDYGQGISSTTTITYEEQLVLPDGRLGWLQWTEQVLVDPAGALLECQAVGRDITAQKHVAEQQQQINDVLELRGNARAKALRGTNQRLLAEIYERQRVELALKQAHQQLTFHVENSPLAVIEFNGAASVQYWSPQAERMLGWDASEVLGQSFKLWQLVHATDQIEVADCFNQLRSGQTPRSRLQSRTLTKSGRVLHCEWHNSALLDEAGNLVSILALVHDVSDRHLAQRTLLRLVEFEKLITTISTRFIKLGLDSIDSNILWGLQAIATFVDVDRSYIFLLSDDGTQLQASHEWCAAAIRPYVPQKTVNVATVQWWMEQIGQGKSVNIPRVSDLSLEAQTEVAALQVQPCQSLVAMPMTYGGVLIGFIGFDAIRSEKTWDAETLALLNMIGETFTNALERQRAQNQLQQQYQRSHLLAELTLRIRQSLRLDEVLQTTVTEVQAILQADRVLVLRLLPDGYAPVVKEAIAPDYASVLQQGFTDDCFGQEYLQKYGRGRIFVINDVNTDSVLPCLRDFLQAFQVKSKLVVPILLQQKLWGLLILHQCSAPRYWSGSEMELLQQLVDQLSIGLTQAELLEALEQSEAKFRDLVERTNDWVWEMDLQGLFTYVNPRVSQILGYRPEEILGQPIFDFMTPENGQRFAALLQAHNDRHEPFINLEQTIQHKAGRAIVLETSGLTVYDAQNCPQGYRGIGRDITQRKEAEVEMRHALIKERELHELKSRFVSMTSHEFRTPLSTILSSAELLEHYGHRWSEEEKREQLQMIQAAVERMTNLLEDVLLLGKAEAGKLSVNRVKCEVVQLCQALTGEIRQSDNHQHQLEFIASAPAINVYIDIKLLLQILTNLLSNAVKYSPVGSLVQFRVESDDQSVVFYVRDQGIGIPAGDRPHLFQSFHRASNVGTTPGSGLGLVIVKRCVDLLGGHIKVDSHEGKGTSFVVNLPHNGSTASCEP